MASLLTVFATARILRGQELPLIPPKPSGKSGKLAKSDAHNLWERLDKHEAAVLLFAKESDISPAISSYLQMMANKRLEPIGSHSDGVGCGVGVVVTLI